MRKFFFVLLAFGLVSIPVRAERFKIIHPLNNSFIIGLEVVIELGKELGSYGDPLNVCSIDEVQVQVNGREVSVQWRKNAYGNFFAMVELDREKRVQEIEYDSRLCGSEKIHVQVLEEDQYEPAYKLAHYILESKSPHKLNYNWPDAVMLYGLSSFSLVDPEHADTYLNYIGTFFQKYDRRGYPRVTTPDLCLIAITAVEMKRNYHLDIGTKSVDATVRFLEHEPRNPLGALDHVGHNHRFRSWLPKTRHLMAWSAHLLGDPSALWVDSLVMYAVTAAKIARLSEDEDLFDFALRQPIIFSTVLQEANGLYKHAYYWKKGRVAPKGYYYWLRGNGWAMVSIVEILSMTPESHPKRDKLIGILKKQVEAIVGFQDPIYGLWDTLILNPDGQGYLETSGSALVAYAMAKAVQLGLIEEKYIDNVLQAYKGLSSRIYQDGDKILFTGMSGHTNAMKSRAWYLSILVDENAVNKGYGVGPYLLLSKTLKEMEALQ